MFALPARARLASDAEPVQVFDNRGLVFRPAAGGVDVLKAQQQPAAEPRPGFGVAQRRIGVAEV
jgi:hypothetical protein